MKRLFDPKLNCITYELFAGEFFVSAEPNVVLITLLGSCVAVCLFDSVNGVVGMNHFMLPGQHFPGKDTRADPKYGTGATHLLLEAMKEKGASQGNLKAKVFGAGRVVEHFSRDIAGDNEVFIRNKLAELKIPIISEDLGGRTGRKIYFFSRTHDVLLKRIKEAGFLATQEQAADGLFQNLGAIRENRKINN